MARIWSVRIYDRNWDFIKTNGWQDYAEVFGCSTNVQDILNDEYSNSGVTLVSLTQWWEALTGNEVLCEFETDNIHLYNASPLPVRFTLHWAIQTFHWKRPYEWKPWANTIAYYPLNWDANDYSGNNRNLTTNNMIYTSWWPWQVAVFTSFWNYAYYQDNSLFDLRSPFTYNVRANASSITSWYYNGSHPYWNTLISIQDGTTIASHCEDLWFWLWNKVIWYQWNVDYMDGWTISTNHRYNIVFTYDGNGGKKLYIDWVQVASDTITPTSVSYSNARLVLSRSATSYNAQPYDWMLSNVIVENKARTADEVLNYYNRSKVNYEGG